MSHQLGRAVSEILHRYFGEIVQQVGKDLFTYGSKPISMIVKISGLPRSQVIESLRTLLKFDLATFEPSINETIADYKLLPENVLLLIRYPRYLLQMKTKYGSEAEVLVEELLHHGTCTSTALLVTTATKYKDGKEKDFNVVQLKDTFISLATAGYIQQAPVAELKEGSDIPTLVPVATIVPDINARVLIQAVNSGNMAEINDNVYWRVNFDRFHQDFRDDLMVKAVTRRIDENAGEVMRLMLQQMYLSSAAWAGEGSPAPAPDLRERTDRPLLRTHADHYLKVIEESGAGFVRRCGDASGGQWVVRAKHAAEQLVLATLDHLVTERLGSKAARIFRLIRTKKYIEEEDIQKYAMLPNKECKELTYKLLEEHFISLQPMRKAASSGGMAKAIYLYHIKLYDQKTIDKILLSPSSCASGNTDHAAASAPHSFPRFVPMLSCVTGAILSILNVLAAVFWFCLCFVIWLVLLLGLTTYCCALRTWILLAIGILQLLFPLIWVAICATELIYRSLHNVVRRAAHERNAHARLLDKQRRVRSIVHHMRLRGEPQANIDDVEETLTPPEIAMLQGIEKRLKQLNTAELELDKTLFILKWYFMYSQ